MKDRIPLKAIVKWAIERGLTTAKHYEPNPFVKLCLSWFAWEIGCFIAAYRKARHESESDSQ